MWAAPSEARGARVAAWSGELRTRRAAQWAVRRVWPATQRARLGALPEMRAEQSAALQETPAELLVPPWAVRRERPQQLAGLMLRVD